MEFGVLVTLNYPVAVFVHHHIIKISKDLKIKCPACLHTIAVISLLMPSHACLSPPLSTVTGPGSSFRSPLLTLVPRMAVAMPDAGCGGGSTSSGGDGVG